MLPTLRRFLPLLVLSLPAAACGGGEVDEAGSGAGGSGAAGTSGGSSGGAGASGATSGSSGSSGSTAGKAGASGTAGTGGSSAGSSTAGTSGSAGSAAGQSGASGSAGGCVDKPPTGKTFCSLPSATPAPANLKVPAGFCVRSYTTPGQVVSPRTMRFAPNGDLFIGAPAVGSPGGAGGGLGAIFVLPDDDHDGKSDAALLYAGGGGLQGTASCVDRDKDPNDFACLHGIAFADGGLYYTRWNEVRRFAYTMGDRKSPATAGDLVATLGMPKSDVYRYTHTLDKGADGRMYVSRGRFEAACTALTADAEMKKGAVVAFKAGDPVGDATMVSDGFRNPMYLRCKDGGACLANELSGDGWIGLGQESIFVVKEGDHLGYPCCYKKDKPAPGGTQQLCSSVADVAAAFPISHTPFGMDWAPAGWPCGYGGGLFVAKHGQVGSWANANVVFFPAGADGVPTGKEEPFTTGFGLGGTTIQARPADVAFAPDGRMFVIQDQDNDKGGMVYWIAPESLEVPAGW